MNMKTRAVIVVLFLCQSLALAASAEGEGGWGLLEPLGRWLNLFLLSGLLVYLLRQPLKNFFSGRRQAIQADMKEARKVRDEAQAKFAAMEDRMAHLQEELDQIRRQGHEQAEAEGRRIIEQAEQDAAKILNSAQREIESQARAARAELRTFVGRLALELAEQKVQARMGPGEQAALVERFVIELGKEKEGSS